MAASALLYLNRGHRATPQPVALWGEESSSRHVAESMTVFLGCFVMSVSYIASYWLLDPASPLESVQNVISCVGCPIGAVLLCTGSLTFVSVERPEKVFYAMTALLFSLIMVGVSLLVDFLVVSILVFDQSAEGGTSMAISRILVFVPVLLFNWLSVVVFMKNWKAIDELRRRSRTALVTDELNYGNYPSWEPEQPSASDRNPCYPRCSASQDRIDAMWPSSTSPPSYDLAVSTYAGRQAERLRTESEVDRVNILSEMTEQSRNVEHSVELKEEVATKSDAEGADTAHRERRSETMGHAQAEFDGRFHLGFLGDQRRNEL